MRIGTRILQLWWWGGNDRIGALDDGASWGPPSHHLPCAFPMPTEFLESVAAIYQDLLSGRTPNTVVVPTSSSGQHRQRPPLGEAGLLEGVEASLFSQRLESLCDRHKYR